LPGAKISESIGEILLQIVGKINSYVQNNIVP